MSDSPLMYIRRKFGEIAVDLGYLVQDQVDVVLSRKGITGQMLGQLFVDEGLLDDEKLAHIIAEQFGCPYVPFDALDDPGMQAFFEIEFMVRRKIIPFEQKQGGIGVAVADPMDFFMAVDDMEMCKNGHYSIVIVSGKKLQAFLQRLDTSRDVLDISEEMRLPVVRESKSGEYEISTERVDASESPVVKLVDSTIMDAMNKKASDIHIEGTARGVVIRYRIDGMLHQVTEPLDIKHQNPVISRLKVMSELDISEKRIPQDGRFKLKVKGRFVDFRISVLPTIFGEDAVIRILDQERMAPAAGKLSLDGMDLPDVELTRLRRQVKSPYGMFLMTGPTGSGKTSTLYRALAEVNAKDTKIITIEDPVEYQLPGIVQIQVNDKKGLTFSKGLRSILRHDPDKILVGEIRDAETAQIALQSALTGHQVFTTVHANSSFEVINRFVHMGIAPYNLVSALNCIVAQRLIRCLCSCKEPYKINPEELMESGLRPHLHLHATCYRAVGCDQCNGTGYFGRKAIIEHVEMDDNLRAMFIQQANATEMTRYALEKGVVFLRKAALNEVWQGVTTLSEANRVTFIEQEVDDEVV